jgi:hypothetical protein
LALDVQRGGIPRGPAKSFKCANPVLLFLEALFLQVLLFDAHAEAD